MEREALAELTTLRQERRSIRKRFKAHQRGATATRRSLSPSAREWFAILRPMLLDSRPILKPAEFSKRRILIDGKYRTHTVQVKPQVYGRPTFRNRIENGKHV